MKKRLVFGAAATAALTLAGVGWYFTAMPGPHHRGPIGEITEEERALAERLRGHLDALARDIGPRPAGNGPALRQTRAYIEATWKAMGYAVRVQETGVEEQPNLEVELPGLSGAELVVVGAHYDTVPLSPGADDNTSGIAALLELSRALAGKRFERTVRLVAFADEERGMVGSRVYATRLSLGRARVSAMISLEMLGFYSDEPGSQRYPLSMLSWLYPDRADFLGVVANPRSVALLRKVVGTMRASVAMPCEGMAAPEALRDIGRSDNRSFWEQGYPAVMMTDTSNFRNPHYHQPGDTVETLDLSRLARVTRGLPFVVESLSGGKGPRRV